VEEIIAEIQRDYLEEIKKASTLKELDTLYLALFGKSGAITLLPKKFSGLSKSELQQIGPLFNKTKIGLEQTIETRRTQIREHSYQKLKTEELGFHLRGGKLNPPERWQAKRQGHLHLSSQFKKEIIDLFGKLGFQQFDAPHIELDKYNFEYLNIPKDHPSRDLWDTFYIDTSGTNIEPGQLLLRTHTSNFWPRLMEQGKTPLRAMSFDRCFRYEATDARHSHTFNQFEIAVVGENISMANLRQLSDYLLKGILGKEARSRFRPKYYPFVEPGVGIDSLCVFCHGKGCKICSGTGWFEIAGAGMIHPNVFKFTGLNPKKYTGLAWGFGPDRILMLKYGIEDIRYFLEGDLKFLQKY